MQLERSNLSSKNIVLRSDHDVSVNFIRDVGEGKYFESRYVRRNPEYVCCYLSSQTGCNRGCKMCWLTTTGQTSFDHASDFDYLAQAQSVLHHYWKTPVESRASRINYNFMARGEPLSNPSLLQKSQLVFNSLLREAFELVPRFNISTIMPHGLTNEKPLWQIFAGITPSIYYSLYSVEEEFRSHWLPGALSPEIALQMLADYQQKSQKLIILHWPWIKGHNDRLHHVQNIAKTVKKSGIVVQYRCVRYNPPPGSNTEESEDYEELTWCLAQMLQCKYKIISRVGEDVRASCGQFITSEEL